MPTARNTLGEKRQENADSAEERLAFSKLDRSVPYRPIRSRSTTSAL